MAALSWTGWQFLLDYAIDFSNKQKACISVTTEDQGGHKNYLSPANKIIKI